MSWPAWDDLDAIKTVSSRIADITVGCWVAMAALEILAVFPTRFKKMLAGLGLFAFLLAVSGEVVERKYDHRRVADAECLLPRLDFKYAARLRDGIRSYLEGA